MAQLDPQDVVKKLVSVLEAYGTTFHSEEHQGESMLRVQVEKRLSQNTKTTLQSVGAFLILNLPGDTDKTVAAGAEVIGLGNSSQSLELSNP